MITIIGEAASALRQATCRKCGAILQYVLIDVRERIERDYTGDTELVRFIHCPRCGNEVRVAMG